MDELCAALRVEGFSQLTVSDLRIDLIGEFCVRTVVLQGERTDRFDYVPSGQDILPEEILAAWETHNANLA